MVLPSTVSCPTDLTDNEVAAWQLLRDHDLRASYQTLRGAGYGTIQRLEKFKKLGVNLDDPEQFTRLVGDLESIPKSTCTTFICNRTNVALTDLYDNEVAAWQLLRDHNLHACYQTLRDAGCSTLSHLSRLVADGNTGNPYNIDNPAFQVSWPSDAEILSRIGGRN